MSSFEPNWEAAQTNMAEVVRTGKCPWCCDATTELYVFEKMNPMQPKIIDYPQETFEESQKRWLSEGKITKKQYKRAMSI